MTDSATDGAADSGQVLYEQVDGIAILTLNQPDKLNALTDAMVEACVRHIGAARLDDAVRVLVLTGAGRGFCSGADTGRMQSVAEAATPVSVKTRLQNGLQRIPLALADFDKPVLAAINGVAAGAGMDLALMCDLRFAAASARFSESYAKLGLAPGAGGAWFLPRVVGTAKALELLWTADLINAEEALRIGLVQRVWPDDQLRAETLNFARRLAKAPPLSVRLIKRAVYEGLSMNLKTGLELVSAYLSIARTSNDHTEAVAAFRDKRDGNFTGR